MVEDLIKSSAGLHVVEASTYTEEGIINVRDTACDALLAHRVEQKMRGTRIEHVANKIHVAIPQQRDNVARPPFIPAGVKDKKKFDKNDPERIRVERDDEVEMEGRGIFSANTKSEYQISPFVLIDPHLRT